MKAINVRLGLGNVSIVSFSISSEIGLLMIKSVKRRPFLVRMKVAGFKSNARICRTMPKAVITRSSFVNGANKL